MSYKYFIFLFAMISCFGKTTFIQNEKGELITKNKEEIQFNDFDKKFEKPEFHKAFIKMIISLVAIIFLCIITFWVFKKISKAKMTTANNNKALKILEKRILSPKTMLYIVEYENTKTLISESHLDVKMKIVKDKNLQS